MPLSRWSHALRARGSHKRAAQFRDPLMRAARRVRAVARRKRVNAARVPRCPADAQPARRRKRAMLQAAPHVRARSVIDTTIAASMPPAVNSRCSLCACGSRVCACALMRAWRERVQKAMRVASRGAMPSARVKDVHHSSLILLPSAIVISHMMTAFALPARQAGKLKA